MTTDQSFKLCKLIHSYSLQIEYLNLLVKYWLMEPGEAQAEIDLVSSKMDFASERLCQLRLAQQVNWRAHGHSIDPSLIPDLLFV